MIGSIAADARGHARASFGVISDAFQRLAIGRAVLTGLALFLIGCVGGALVCFFSVINGQAPSIVGLVAYTIIGLCGFAIAWRKMTIEAKKAETRALEKSGETRGQLRVIKSQLKHFRVESEGKIDELEQQIRTANTLLNEVFAAIKRVKIADPDIDRLYGRWKNGGDETPTPLP